MNRRIRDIYGAGKISFCPSHVLNYFRVNNFTLFSMEIFVHKNKLLFLDKKKLSPARYNILKAHSSLSFGITIAILSSVVYPLCLLFLIPWRHYLWRRLPDHSAVNWKDASVRSPRRQSSGCKSCYERDIWRGMTENHLPDETVSRMIPTSCIFVIKHAVNLTLQTNILCNISRNNEMLQPQLYQREIHINA